MDDIERKVAVPERGLPLMLRRTDDGDGGAERLGELWQAHAERIDADLLRHGAVLFRGFGIGDQETFQQTLARFACPLMEYVDGNSPRTKLTASVYTSTEYPPGYFISLHNELSYSKRWPARLFFCCVVAPEEGGETPLVDGRALLRELPREIVDQFRARGVRYVRNLHGGRGYGPSWQKTFQTEARTDVEALTGAAGAEAEWLDDGSLRLMQLGVGTARHPVTGEEVWFNQADQFHPSTHPEELYRSMLALYKGREALLPQNATFGDGGEIPPAYLTTIRQVTRSNLAAFAWRQGDLLMVDNMLAAHGRNPFRGPRRILVSMTDAPARRSQSEGSAS